MINKALCICNLMNFSIGLTLMLIVVLLFKAERHKNFRVDFEDEKSFAIHKLILSVMFNLK